MDLKLKNNQSFSLGNSIANVIKTNCTTAFVKDCPNVSGMAILQQCTNLTRVRLDIGNVSASLGELLAFANLSGFNDNYELQAKARLVGTWTINNYYTAEQLATAQAAFDGLTIIPDENYLINFNDLAVQTLDPEKPNYNPAVAIILNNNNKGTLTNAPVVSGGGRWFLTKTQAAAITDIGGWFAKKTSVSDDNNIVSNTVATYSFDSFDEFEYFGVTSIGDGIYGDRGFNQSSLTSITIPTTVAAIKMAQNANSYAAFKGCNKLERVTIKSNSYIISNTGVFSGCSKLNSLDLSKCTNTDFPAETVNGCSSLENIILPPNIKSIGHKAFFGCAKLVVDFVIPDIVTSLGGSIGAVFNNSGIRSIKFGSGITTIIKGYNVQLGYGMCGQCGKLERVEFSDEIKSINGYAFGSCGKLEEIICRATVPPTLASVAIPNNANLKIYVPAESVEMYQTASVWSNYASKILEIPAE